MLFGEWSSYTLILLHARMYACIHMDKGHKKRALTHMQMHQDALTNSSRRFYQNVKGFLKKLLVYKKDLQTHKQLAHQEYTIHFIIRKRPTMLSMQSKYSILAGKSEPS